MTKLTMPQDGRIFIPQDVRDRYGFSDETPIRIVETRSGILLVPMGKHAMSDELAKELADWQDLSTSTWGAFPYEELSAISPKPDQNPVWLKADS